MQPETTLPKSTTNLKNKKTFMLVAIIIIFLVAVFGMIFILKFAIPSNNSNVKKAISSDSVITAISNPKTIAGLSPNLYKQQVNGSIGTINITYELSGYTYSVSTKTNHYLTFTAINPSLKDDSATIQNQMTVFMSQNGLNSTKNYGDTTSKGITSTAYSNNNVVCQLTDTNITSTNTIKAFRYHTIACVDVSAIKQEYAAIEKMLTIYKQSQKLPNFTFAFRTIATKDNISYSIISLTAGKIYPRLLFAAIDNNWSYIGDLSAGDAKYDTGKYIITPDIKSKISDPKYKGFIIAEIH